jgi:hypothetical protein
MTDRYLTKSKFQLAMECPTKLYYYGKPEYSNLKCEDSFLLALAESGFQVAELARAYYPEGILIETLDYVQALAETNKLLERDKVVIFEAAVCHQNLFVRTDILIKENDHLTFLEVKSKSIGEDDQSFFAGKDDKKRINSTWEPYIFDAAFQKYVLIKAFPNYRISSYLLLTDKATKCPSNGLHQKFRIKQDEAGRVKVVKTLALTDEEKAAWILRKVNVADEIDFIFNYMKFRDMNFDGYVNFLREHYQQDIKVKPELGSICKKCEFKLDPKNSDKKLKSGFQECWSEVCGLKEGESTVLDIWGYSSDGAIKSGVFLTKFLTGEHIKVKENDKPGLSSSQRKWKQIEKIKDNDPTEYLDIANLKEEIKNWKYPLHFIDFETAMPAIPFMKNDRPFQRIAFQFSHHVLHENGTVEHAGEYFNNQIGINPNLDFIRVLKKELENTKGTIFRYAAHENTYLNIIRRQLLNSRDKISDKDELIAFIEQISQPTKDCNPKWNVGPRNMVDLCNVVERFYMDPLAKGACSIKKVFPAILQHSKFLQEKYSKPIYGADGGIKSLNFKDKIWVERDGDKIRDPYDSLDPLYKGMHFSDGEIEFLFHDDKIKEGGGASIAYARMQFSEMSSKERDELKRALLQYCELDTLAMVMIVEAWRDMIRN